MAATAACIMKHQLMKDFNQYCVKSVYIRSYSGPNIPAFGLNTERYSVSLRNIQSKCGKSWTRITPKTDTFYAAQVINNLFICSVSIMADDVNCCYVNGKPQDGNPKKRRIDGNNINYNFSNNNNNTKTAEKCPLKYNSKLNFLYLSPSSDIYHTDRIITEPFASSSNRDDFLYFPLLNTTFVNLNAYDEIQLKDGLFFLATHNGIYERTTSGNMKCNLHFLKPYFCAQRRI